MRENQLKLLQSERGIVLDAEIVVVVLAMETIFNYACAIITMCRIYYRVITYNCCIHIFITILFCVHAYVPSSMLDIEFVDVCGRTNLTV